jgi:lysylphosphatidylglycerol synthetase-like protein (DUF2156 family)
VLGQQVRGEVVQRVPTRVNVLAGLTAVGGVLAILASLPPVSARVAGLDRIVNPATWIGAQIVTSAVSLLVGVGLLYLATNLQRQKRSAWAIATALFALNGVVWWLHSTTPGGEPARYPIEIAYSALMVTLLVLSRRSFGALPDPPSLFQLLRFAGVYLAAVFVYGYAALTIEKDHLDKAPTPLANLHTIVAELVGLRGAYEYHSGPFGRIFPTSMTLLGLGGAAIALVLAMRPLIARPRNADDWRHAYRLVHTYGSDTLDYFALRHDKSYFFSSDGEAMIAYTYLGRHALASGDPIGHPGSIDLVIDEYVAMCRRHGWGYAFLCVREADVERYERLGLRTMYLGDEAVIDCRTFRLDGKRHKSMRQSVNRVARTYHFETLPETEASPELIAQLNDISRRWRGKAPERGFTMALSQEVEGTNPDFQLCVAFDEHGVPGGFLRLVPVFADPPGMTLDMMRRDPGTPNGMTEFLVANSVFALRDAGIERLSMNFAMMGRLFAKDLHFTFGQRVLKVFVNLLNPFFQIKSLHDFNRRFRPMWLPRAIVYEDQRSLPEVAILLGGVEGFLALPVIGRYFVPQRFDEVVAAS